MLISLIIDLDLPYFITLLFTVNYTSKVFLFFTLIHYLTFLPFPFLRVSEVLSTFFILEISNDLFLTLCK